VPDEIQKCLHETNSRDEAGLSGRGCRKSAPRCNILHGAWLLNRRIAPI
jgi:hypothetical protein